MNSFKPKTLFPIACRMATFFTFFSFLLSAQAQNDNYWLSFEQDSVYMGRLKREQAPIKHTFRFRVGEKFPIKITEVKADCACITTSFPQEEMFPGQYGEIEVVFKPYRAGPFSKEFIVLMDGKKDEIALKMTGYLEAFYPSPSLEYPIKRGYLRFRSKKVHLGNVSLGAVFKKEIEVYNESNSPIAFSDSVSIPDFIQIGFPANRKIPAKSMATFSLYYDPDQRNDFGYLVDSFSIYIKGKELQPLPLEVTAFVLPQKAMPDGKGGLPLLSVSDDSLDLGVLKDLDQEIVSFQLMNTGKAPLQIKKVASQPGCDVLTLEATEIAPLSSVNLNAIITDNGEKGKQQRTISVFTNDPTSPYRPIRVFFQLK